MRRVGVFFLDKVCVTLLFLSERNRFCLQSLLSRVSCQFLKLFLFYHLDNRVIFSVRVEDFRFDVYPCFDRSPRFKRFLTGEIRYFSIT
jgi:hypothetical protein